ncbi:MAG: peptidyl-prolyl cis-trans isomerase [Acidobacteriota bacterium]
MLQQMREYFRYLKWLLLIIVVMFIWWAFNVGGSAPRGGRAADWAARVNGHPIPIPVFQSYARQLDSSYQSLLGDQYAERRSLIRVGRQAIDRLVDEELVYQEALAQGLRVSPREVAEAITRDPALQEDGRFIGLERYRNLFRGGRVSIEDYESQVARELLIEKFRALIEDGVTVAEAEVLQEFLQRNERSTVDYVLLPPSGALAGGEPGDEEIRRYYGRHTERYSLGEGRTGIYVLLSPSEVLDSVEVSEEDVRSAYDRALPTRFSLPEQRRASHILFRVAPDASPSEVEKIEAKARDVLRRARGGEDFAELARENSEDGSASNGGDLSFFGRGQMVKEFEEAAFTLAVGEISDLVRTGYGFHIIKVTDARDPRTVPFEEARDQLREGLRLAAARSLVLERSREFAEAAGGGRLETVARSQGVTVSDTGVVRPGDALPGLAASQAVVARMMSLGEGEVSGPIPVPLGQVVVQITGTVPPEPQPLDAVREQVVKDLRADRQRAALEESIAAVRRDGGTIGDLARRLKLEVRTADDLARGAPLPDVVGVPAVGRLLRSLPPGEIAQPLLTPSGFLVLSVRERRDHLEDLATQRDAIRDALIRQRRDRLYRSLLRRLRQRSEVQINEPLVAALDRG